MPATVITESTLLVETALLPVFALSPESRWAWAAGAAQARPATTSVRMEWRMVI